MQFDRRYVSEVQAVNRDEMNITNEKKEPSDEKRPDNQDQDSPKTINRRENPVNNENTKPDQTRDQREAMTRSLTERKKPVDCRRVVSFVRDVSASHYYLPLVALKRYKRVRFG